MEEKSNIVEIEYILADGSVELLTVPTEVAAIVVGIKRYEQKIDKSIQRHESMTTFEDVEEVIPKGRISDYLLSVVQDVELRQLRAALLSAICELGPEQQRRVYMRYFLDMKLADIAKIENVTIRAVEKSINVAIRRLRNML